MMKPCHATTKYEPPPRPFSRAFDPINLVAAEVTRLKPHLAPRFDDLAAFVPTGMNLIRPNPAKKLLGWRQLVATAAALRPAGRPNLNDDSRPPIRHSSFVIQFAQMPSTLRNTTCNTEINSN